MPDSRGHCTTGQDKGSADSKHRDLRSPLFLATANFWQPQPQMAMAMAGFWGDAEPVEQLPVYGRSGVLI